ncbi:MAG: beta-Ala-His dipeptidase, partial [Lachnospiraceae bacterium]
AYALAILDDDTIIHPPIAAVFTVDEEIGMLGADAMDMSDLKAQYLLNIDSEEEGIFLTSCAGGVTTEITLPAKMISVDDAKDREAMEEYQVEITGLTGGHSGTEIHRGRGNAHKLLGRLLYAWNPAVRYGIKTIEGGTKDNAIACHVSMNILVVKEDVEILMEIGQSMEEDWKREYAFTDGGLRLIITKIEKNNGTTDTKDNDEYIMMDPKSREKLTFFLMQAPNGVIRMSVEVEGLVETSLNCGVLSLDEDGVHLGFLIRSSIESAKWAVLDQLQYLTEFIGGDFNSTGDYPGWQYKADSKLREIMAGVYEEQYGKKPEIMGIHAGLECGIFADRIPGIDIVSFGPDIKDIHTFKERLSIESVERTWNLILEVLRRL